MRATLFALEFYLHSNEYTQQHEMRHALDLHKTNLPIFSFCLRHQHVINDHRRQKRKSMKQQWKRIRRRLIGCDRKRCEAVWKMCVLVFDKGSHAQWNEPGGRHELTLSIPSRERRCVRVRSWPLLSRRRCDLVEIELNRQEVGLSTSINAVRAVSGLGSVPCQSFSSSPLCAHTVRL